jgi:hypothetical protein
MRETRYGIPDFRLRHPVQNCKAATGADGFLKTLDRNQNTSKLKQLNRIKTSTRYAAHFHNRKI